MTGIPELAASLSVSRLDAALKERKSLSRTKSQPTHRKTERSPDKDGVTKTSVDIRSRISVGGDGSDRQNKRDSKAGNIPKSSLIHLEGLRKRSSKDKLPSPDGAEHSENFRISLTAAKLSPRSKRNKEKCQQDTVAKGDSGKELHEPESAPQVERLHTDFVDAVDDDTGVASKVPESEEVNSKSGVTSRPRSDSRVSQPRRERTKNTLTRRSSGAEYNQPKGTALWPPNSGQVHPPHTSKESGIPDDEDEASESKIRQIWRKELGLDVRPPRRQFGPKEYITGLAVGYPGQKAAKPQQTITTTVVPTAKICVSEIQKRRKVLPPIDSKAKAKTSKNDAAQKAPAPNRVKDINALAVDLCRGATIEIGNSETEAVYRTYLEARKNAFYFHIQSNVSSARSKYHRPCHAPPNSDDDGDDQGVQEVWNDSSYTRIVRIASPDNDGETVVTHTIDASKVFDFGGRVIRKTQIDIFLPSETPSDEIQGGNEDEDDDDGADYNQNEKDSDTSKRVVRHQTASKEQVGKRENGAKEKRVGNQPSYAASEEDDEEDSDDDGSDESCDSDDDDDDDDDY